MKLLNSYGLPESLVNVMCKFREPKEDRMGVTELIGAALVRHLKKKHWDEIEEDASERLWALLGTSLHYVLLNGIPENAFGEERLEAKFNGITIAGQSDLYHEKEVTDWKTTSVYSFLLGIKPEWIAQLNLYGWLWGKNGFEVNSLKIHAILRDWTKSKMLSNADYPKIPFITVKIPIWTLRETEDFIKQRIALHKTIPPPECTPEEKWTRPNTYAVMKKGQIKAKKVLESYKEAEEWIGDQKDLFVEERKGLNVKCEEYCNVSKFCQYAQGGGLL